MMYQAPQFYPQYDATQQQYAAPTVIAVQPTMPTMQAMPTMTVMQPGAPHDMSNMGQVPQVQDFSVPDPNASQAGSGIFYKTRICIKWSEGYCQYGDKCRYAHGEHELRAANQNEHQHQPQQHDGFDMNSLPPEMQHLQGDEKQKVVRELMKKTKLCEHYKKGSCPYGDRCFFAHGDLELRDAPDMGGKLGRGNGPLTVANSTPARSASKGLKRSLDSFEPSGAIAAEIEKVQADLAIAEGEYASAQKTVADLQDRLKDMPATVLAYALLEPRKGEAAARQKCDTFRARVDELKYMAMWNTTKKSRPSDTTAAGSAAEFCETEAHIDMWATMTLRYSASLTWLKGVRDRLNKYIEDIENHVEGQ